jgi:vitamin B12 transporter
VQELGSGLALMLARSLRIFAASLTGLSLLALHGSKRVAAGENPPVEGRLPSSNAAEGASPLQSAPVQSAPVQGAPAEVEPLAEVTVRVESAGNRLRGSAQAVKVVETGEARRHTADLGEVLARTEGVAVQRSGGLGSESRLSLHGLTGDQIRVFLDGVPLEFSGFGLGISTVPLDWVERIEIYRGVVPVRLGIDALGGAIDIVTDQAVHGTSVTAAYTTGAFGTHQLALNGRTLHPEAGFLTRASAFYDTAANDYLIDVRVADPLGRLRPARVRRFHDGYRAGGGSVELGFVDRPWARALLLEVFGTSFDKDLQHNVNMSVPYGDASYGQTAVGGTVRYEQPLGSTPFNATALFGYAYRRLDFRDTSRWVYDWFGNRVFERSEGSGETATLASDRSQWEQRALGRLGMTYRVADLHGLRLVLAPDFTTRSGSERLRLNPDRLDPLTTRRDVLQIIAGLEYSYRDLADDVENSAFAKYYLYRPATDQVEVFDNSIRHIEDTTQRVGAGDAFRVWLLPWLLGKLSYEYATRLPRPDEVFGDGSLVLPNLELEPETGHNANVGFMIESTPNPAVGDLSVEGSGFLRHTEDMVVRLLAEDRVHSIHQNVGTARTLGLDGVLRWVSPSRRLTLQANVTWQDQRNLSDRGAFAPFDGQRVPNRPWLFANASAWLRFPQLGASNAELVLSWVSHYVHEFLPGWEETTTADDTNRIPTQLTHSAGLMYSVQGPWTLDFALDLSNLTDERVFDVLGVQRPGRAAFFKVTVGWNREGDRALPVDSVELN